MKPPLKILISSDGDEIEFVRTIPKSKNNAAELFVYKFIKSETKLNMQFEMNEETLSKNLSNFFKIILA